MKCSSDRTLSFQCSQVYVILCLQVHLYESIKPLFANKPLLVVLSKSDVVKLAELPADRREAFKPFEKEGVPLVEMSSLTGDGVMQVKTDACEALLAFRVDQKLRTKKVEGVLNRLHVAMPAQRDGKPRPPCIPGTKSLLFVMKVI